MELIDLKKKKKKKIIVLDEMLILYGFHKSYIKKYKKFCIKAVKRSLNYKKLNSSIIKKIFIKDFYNLLFK